MELNLDNPIFTIYVNVEGMDRETTEAILKEQNKIYGIYKNVTFWIIPSNVSKIETVWLGKYGQNKIDEESIQNVIDHINKVIDVLSDGTSDESIKARLRDLQLDNLLN